MLKKTFFIFIAFNYLVISGCMNVPNNQGDACSIIKQKKSWRSALKKTERKWGVSPGMQLAFIKTESNFRPTARTERKYFLGVFAFGINLLSWCNIAIWTWTGAPHFRFVFWKARSNEGRCCKIEHALSIVRGASKLIKLHEPKTRHRHNIFMLLLIYFSFLQR